MPTAVMLGVTSAATKRLAHFTELNRFSIDPDWEVHFVRSSKSHFDISDANFSEAMRIADSVPEPHIFAVLKAESSRANHEARAEQRRKDVAAAIRPYFRFCWLEAADLGALSGTSPEVFFSKFNRLLALEAEWGLRVRPANLRSPLLLPRVCFSVARGDDLLWEAADRYGDAGNIEVACNAIAKFGGSYMRSTVDGSSWKWTDSADRVFCHQGARHRVAAHPKNRKYSFRIEDGFHYDVTSKSGRPFRLTGNSGIQRHADAGKHINVDPHGDIL
jgi:hypothetical protein